jgi:hypothetical protein
VTENRDPVKIKGQEEEEDRTIVKKILLSSDNDELNKVEESLALPSNGKMKQKVNW